VSSPSHRAASTSNEDKAHIADEVKIAVPTLRSLYEVPPPLGAEGERTNKKAVDDHNADESPWATEVTSGTLPTEKRSSHVLYYEVHRRFRHKDAEAATDESRSKTRGLTALFLHGGPGAGCFPNHVRFFSPELYETVVLLDQRGCGKSTPLGETRNNTLGLLVEDVERLRVCLLEEMEGGEDDASARPWDVILGGSWGCTLALAYVHAFPKHVRAMVLRGVCLFRSKEIDWLFGDPPPSVGRFGASSSSNLRTPNLRCLLQGVGNINTSSSIQTVRKGEKEVSAAQISDASTISKKSTASAIFPKAWKEFCKGSDVGSPATVTTSDNSRGILHRYYNLLLGSDPLVRFAAVKSWLRWEMGIYSSGFRGMEGGHERKAQGQNNTVLVWNPATMSWAEEDARVWNNLSVASIDDISTEVDEEMAQLLRRYTSTPLPFERSTPPQSTVVDPMPIEPVSVSPKNSISAPKTNNNSSSNSTFDPTTYIPAQSMLTCYYSTNDNYCIGPYKPFLSLAPPSSVPLSSWYSSKIPPQPMHLSSVLATGPESSSSSFPLPPTIAIQGGNDAICPPDTALDLHHVWKEMELRIVLEGGHSMYGDAVAGEIVKALDRFGHALGVEE